MRSASLNLFLLASVILLGACGDSNSSPPPDATYSDSGLTPDATYSDSDLTPDAGLGDADLPPCSNSADLAPLTIEPGYCVTQRYAIDAVPAAFNFRAEKLWTFDQSKTAKTFEVLERLMDTSGQLGTASSVFSFSVSSNDQLFPSQYLALSPAGLLAAGYNSSDFTNPQGKIYWGTKGETPHEVSADGNYDAVFLDDETLLIDGKGAGDLAGQAVYAVAANKAPMRLIDDLGDFSAVIVRGERTLYAGGYFTDAGGVSGTTRIYGFSLDEVRAALAAGTALYAQQDGDLIFEGNVIDGAAIGDDLVLATADASFAFDSLLRLPVTVQGDKLSSGGDAQPVAAKAGGGSVVALAGDGRLLGLLLVVDTQPSLAFVRPR